MCVSRPGKEVGLGKPPATVPAKPRSQRVIWKIGQPEIGKSPKQTRILPDILVAPHDELVGVSSGGGGTRIVAHYTGTVRSRKDLLPYGGCRLAELRARNAISGAGRIARVQPIRLARSGRLVHSVGVIDG